MDDWNTTQVFSALVFGGVTLIGLRLWVKALAVSPVQRGNWFVDRSVRARWGLIDVLVIAFLWLASQTLTLTILAWASDLPAGQGPPPARISAIVGLVQLLVVTLSLVYLATRYDHAARDFGLASSQFSGGVRSGLTGFAMWIPVVWILQTVLVLFIEYSHATLSGLNESGSLVTIIDYWITAVVVAPVVEEILFRGIVQGWLQRFRKEALAEPNSLILGDFAAPADAGRKKPSKRPLHGYAILITSLLFGLAHLGQGPAPISLFVLSLGLGYLYQRTGSLLACIVAHMVLNAITMAIATTGIFFP